MQMSRILRLQRPIAALLMPLFLFFALRAPTSARSMGDDEVKPTNVKWATKEDVIVINYDLVGSPNDKYDVSIVMKREIDPTFSVVPKTVEGDIGQGSFAGTNREIRWYIIQDYPRGFDGEGYYFEIHVKTIGQQNSLLYYVIGGAALTGGLVLLLAGKSGSGGGGGTPELPMPPGRP